MNSPHTPTQPLVFESDPVAMRARVAEALRGGLRVGFVPTMGALHAGHDSLVARATGECDAVAVSIFVNPTQFGPREDYSRYPRTFEADCGRLRPLGVRWVFTPSVEGMYPAGDATRVHVAGPADRWEGAFRPGHFDGVATVVAKLLSAVPATKAYFGEKDWQQSAVIRRMAADLLLPTEIVVCPTVREADGLAMSSRNVYLSAPERSRAAAIARSLERGSELWDRGVEAGEIERAARESLVELGFEVDYWSIVCEDSLVPGVELPAAAGGVRPRIITACRLGSTRLIDNRGLSPR